MTYNGGIIINRKAGDIMKKYLFQFENPKTIRDIEIEAVNKREAIKIVKKCVNDFNENEPESLRTIFYKHNIIRLN